MRQIHIPLATLALGLILSANTCSDKGAGADAARAMQGKWVLETVNGEAVHMPEGKEAPYLTVDSAAQNVSGFAGCNRVFGPIKVWGDSISFEGLAATRMYCVETQQVEDAFMGALNGTRTFLVKGDKLTLLGGKELAVLRKGN